MRMIRLSTPCPRCGRRQVYAAVIDTAVSNGQAPEGAARECLAPGCGWWSIVAIPYQGACDER